jgi:hypothetical protein
LAEAWLKRPRPGAGRRSVVTIAVDLDQANVGDGVDGHPCSAQVVRHAAVAAHVAVAGDQHDAFVGGGGQHRLREAGVAHALGECHRAIWLAGSAPQWPCAMSASVARC